MSKLTKNILSFMLIFIAFILNTFIVLKIALALFFVAYLMGGGVYKSIVAPLVLTFGMGCIPYLIMFIVVYFLNKNHIKKIIVITLTIHLIECIIFSLNFLNWAIYIK